LEKTLNFKPIVNIIIFAVLFFILTVCYELISKDGNNSIKKDLTSVTRDKWEYIKLKDKEDNHDFIVITDYYGDETEELRIPGRIQGAPVQIINGVLLTSHQRLSRLIIPSEVRELCGYVFSEPEIDEVVFEPGSQLKIIDGRWGFAVRKLKTLELPDSLEYIGDETFGGSFNLEEIYIGPNVKEIGENAFADTKISNIIINPENQWFEFKDGCLIRKQDGKILYTKPEE